jgi:hypothetical protein
MRAGPTTRRMASNPRSAIMADAHFYVDEGRKPASLVFRLSKRQMSRLKTLSASTRVRQSEYLREAVRNLLEKYADDLSDTE